MNEIDVQERRDNFEEVETGFSIEQAQEEARRCLSCRRCLGCGLCLAVCEPKAIAFDEEDEILDLTVDQVILCPEAGTYMPIANGEFGYGTSKNVISALQFERILDEDGPYGGLIMRPFDGNIPEQLGFILKNDSKGEDSQEGNKALLAFTLQQAVSALKKVGDLDISVLVCEAEDPGIPLNEAQREGIRILKGQVLEVKETEDTKNLVVTYMEEDKQKQAEFGMLVISKRLEIQPEIQQVRRRLG
jgi:heterodisulfide reductase subunit A-like polyferredoxin